MLYGYLVMTKVKILKKKEIRNALRDMRGWKYAKNKISKEFEFKDFLAAFKFISSLVSYFQRMDHHPDMHIYYNKIQFELQRFDVGGKVTDRDILVAQKIESEYSKKHK